MTKGVQLDKNLILSNKLAEYISKNPNTVAGFPSDASYVLFPAYDKRLNRKNTLLYEDLTNQGKKVVKAIQTKDKRNPWEFCYSR